jgi:hypothetical protein
MVFRMLVAEVKKSSSRGRRPWWVSAPASTPIETEKIMVRTRATPTSSAVSGRLVAMICPTDCPDTMELPRWPVSTSCQ